MVHTLKTISAIGVLLSMLGLAACGSPAPTSTPTQDLNPIRTEVAATVLAQVTRDLASTPSVTPIPSLTPTTAASSTPTQIVSPTLHVTGTLTTAVTTDQAQWVSQSVADGANFAPGETFTMTWRLKNVGTSTWTPAYMIRFFSGNAFGASNEITLGREVPPGESIDITIKMKAPNTLGGYRSDWVMSNSYRRNFNAPVFLKINIATPATPTPSPTP
jgi:hypothetical protein